MNKLKIILTCAVISGLLLPAYAQEKDSSNFGKEVKRTADTAVKKTKRTAAKGVSTVVDKVYADKVGPGGQTIYIDKHSNYYYIDDKGKRIYVEKARLKDK